jgi:hypothetical protein
MQSYKDKKRCERTALDYIKKSQSTPSWTRGLLSPEDLEEHLSTIVPRVSQEKREGDSMYILEPIPEIFWL